MVIQTPSAEINWKEEKFPLVVIAENIHSPSNIGMIIRNGASFGVERLIFTGSFAHLDSGKFKKSARSAEKYLEIRSSEDTVSVIQGLKAQGYQIIGLEITNSSLGLKELKLEGGKKIALIVGSERHGMSELALKLCDVTVHIELYGSIGSINVASALAIALFEITDKLRFQGGV